MCWTKAVIDWFETTVGSTDDSMNEGVLFRWELDSVVGIGTRLWVYVWANVVRIPVGTRDIFLLQSFQNASGAHVASLVGTGLHHCSA